jgi:GAF domain-containing protein/HAMP domain-containing protein
MKSVEKRPLTEQSMDKAATLAAQDGPAVGNLDAAELSRISRFLAAYSVASSVAILLLYLVAPTWQTLAVAASPLIGAFFFAAGGRLARQERSRASINVMFAGLVVFMPLVTLFWSQAVIPIGLAVTTASVILTFILVRPARRPWYWAVSLLAGLSAWFYSSLAVPWTRFNVDSHPVTAVGLRALLGGVILLVLWQMIRFYQGITSIRVRLAVLFIVLVLLVAAGTSVTSILLGIRTVENRAYDQLETMIVLKEQALNSWIEQLQFALDSLFVENYEYTRAHSVLAGTLSESYQTNARNELRLRFGNILDRTQWFTEIFLIDLEGEIVLSTDQELEGRSVGDEVYFLEGLSDLYVTSPYYDPARGDVSIVFAKPLINQVGITDGVVAGRADMEQLNAIVAQDAMGVEGETYLVGRDYVLLTESLLSGGFVPVHSEAIDAVMSRQMMMGRGQYQNHDGTPVFGVYTWVPRLRVAMLAELDRATVLAGAERTTFVNAGVALLAVAVAGGAALLFSRAISRPLFNLAETASRVAQGNLALEAEVERDDEIGAVARAFNSMTVQLRGLISGLEARVRERTQGLQAVTEVSRATTSVLDPDELMPQVVELVREQFNLYYVGLFLLDESEQEAVLQAGTGIAGREMLAQGWRLPIGGDSMIGQCIATGEAVIRQQVEDEVVHFDNPYLPETQSELALPLRYGNQVRGAMTVQSVERAAFDETDIAVLQNMADQVAVAIQNAQLFDETQQALDRVYQVQQRYQAQAWAEFLHAKPVTGYEQRGESLAPLGRDPLPEVRTVNLTSKPVVQDGRLLVPVRQGEQVVGVVGLERPGGWGEDDVDLVMSLVEQLAVAAENQRLIEETQQREAAERLTREVTTRMREPVELEDVLRTAADQIRAALGSDWVEVRMTGQGQATVPETADAPGSSGT